MVDSLKGYSHLGLWICHKMSDRCGSYTYLQNRSPQYLLTANGGGYTCTALFIHFYGSSDNGTPVLEIDEGPTWKVIEAALMLPPQTFYGISAGYAINV